MSVKAEKATSIELAREATAFYYLSQHSEVAIGLVELPVRKKFAIQE